MASRRPKPALDNYPNSASRRPKPALYPLSFERNAAMDQSQRAGGKRLLLLDLQAAMAGGLPVEGLWEADNALFGVWLLTGWEERQSRRPERYLSRMKRR